MIIDTIDMPFCKPLYSAQQTVVTKRRKLLGKGGFGKVWLVDYKKRVTVTNETPDGWSKDMPVAVKIMRLKEEDMIDIVS